MASNVISLLALALVLGVVCQSLPVSKENYGSRDLDVESIVNSLLSKAEPRRLGASDSLTKKFEILAQCYDGTFTKLRRRNHYENKSSKQEPLYKYCQQNREHLLDSYWFNVGKNMGAALIEPVYNVRYFEEFVSARGFEALSLKDQLIKYRAKWNSAVENRRQSTYCKQMVELVDVELGQWDIKAEKVIEYFEAKTKQPIGRALAMCRIVKDLKF